MAHHLKGEKSPYLLQHVDNPVDWYPWADEAFSKAIAENKPIFLSIGYSTCHWCHVMERESFEDQEVAALINDHFISIKVDREERPDIDAFYMAAAQGMTGRGGWPLTILMTPEKKPFFAATYLPKAGAGGMMGLLDLLAKTAQLWRDDRAGVVRSSEQVLAALASTKTDAAAGQPDEALFDSTYEQFKRAFDPRHGGFGAAPKFPSPHNYSWLLRYWRRTGAEPALTMVEKTLTQMGRGGLFDQVGFGFHRYSTDEKWLVPHFEKMLYDQALLAIAYIELYQATGGVEYAAMVRRIFEYAERDLRDTGGAFYTAEDADTEGEEGKYYVWTPAEIIEVLGEDDGAFAVSVFNITAGSWGGVPHRRGSTGELARERGMDEEGFSARLESVRRRLLSARETRPRPGRDDKILADWNGLMIAALAKAARALGETGYAHAASQAVDFIFDNMISADGRLRHRWRDGDAAVQGYLDDYANMTWALVELYQATFDHRLLERAEALANQLLDHFADESRGGFFLTADDAEELFARRKEPYDGATPSGNSIAALALTALARLTGQSHYEAAARATVAAFETALAATPSSHTAMLEAVDLHLGPGSEIVVVGERDAPGTREMIRIINAGFLPGTFVLFKESGEPDGLGRVAPFTAEMVPVDGRTTAYICRDRACEAPTISPLELADRLGKPASGVSHRASDATG